MSEFRLLEVPIIDENNIWIGLMYPLKEGEEIPPNCVPVHPNDPEKGGSFFIHKWNGERFIEGMPQEQIDLIINRPPEPTPQEQLELENESLKTQIEDLKIKDARLNDDLLFVMESLIVNGLI